mgnify:CR=1 FL=1
MLSANMKLHLCLFNNSFIGVSDQMDFIKETVAEAGCHLSVGRFLRPDSINILIENFSPAARDVVIEFCQHHQTRVFVVMTELKQGRMSRLPTTSFSRASSRSIAVRSLRNSQSISASTPPRIRYPVPQGNVFTTREGLFSTSRSPRSGAGSPRCASWLLRAVGDPVSASEAWIPLSLGELMPISTSRIGTQFKTSRHC